MSETFYVWVTLLTESYADIIVAKLVRRGYDVSPLASSGEMASNGSYSTHLALNVKTNNNEKMKGKVDLDASKFCDEMTTILGELKALYYSMVVQQIGGSCSWRGGNMPKQKKPEPTRFDKVSAEDKAAE